VTYGIFNKRLCALLRPFSTIKNKKSVWEFIGEDELLETDIYSFHYEYNKDRIKEVLEDVIEWGAENNVAELNREDMVVCSLEEIHAYKFGEVVDD
jgi:hypothetical protein